MGKSDCRSIVYPSISTLSNAILSTHAGSDANITSVSVSIERDVFDSKYTFAPFYILKIESVFEEDNDAVVFEAEPNDDRSLSPAYSVPSDANIGRQLCGYLDGFEE